MYLNFLLKKQKRFKIIRHFRDQIMQIHVYVKKLMFDFIKFINNNLYY